MTAAAEVGWTFVPASSLILHLYFAWQPPDPSTWWWVERWNAKKPHPARPAGDREQGGATVGGRV
jgi:hypothetical protein